MYERGPWFDLTSAGGGITRRDRLAGVLILGVAGLDPLRDRMFAGCSIRERELNCLIQLLIESMQRY